MTRLLPPHQNMTLTSLQDMHRRSVARIRGDLPTTLSVLSSPHVEDKRRRLPSSSLREPPLLEDVVIVTGVPMDDVGGGQRAAQLARSALRTGRRVFFFYIYDKIDMSTGNVVPPSVAEENLVHRSLKDCSPQSLFPQLSPNALFVFELPHTDALPYLEQAHLHSLNTVFELIDDWNTSLGHPWYSETVYNTFMQLSNKVVGTALTLVSRLRQEGRIDALYIPNAASEHIFDLYKQYPVPHDLPRSRKFQALYFGSLYGEWFGWEYITTSALRNTDTDFVIIGDPPRALPALPSNVHLLGPRPIDCLPAYLQHCDYALLPFIPGTISDSVSPIKIFEYLFLGKPVVATALPEIMLYPGVAIANSVDHFADLCSNATSSAISKQDTDKFVSLNSWNERLDRLTHWSRQRAFDGSVSVVILVHNNISVIGRCLRSLMHHCSLYLKEVIIVDNQSSDDVVDFVHTTFPNVIVLSNTSNGCSSGRNLGATAASGQYLAFFDSDQWFTSRSGFEEALTILATTKSVGLVGWAAGWFDLNRSDRCGPIADYLPNRGMNLHAKRCGYRTDIGYLGTGGAFLERAVFNSTDHFDELLDPTCFEDTDFSFQIRKLGLQLAFRDLTGIRHEPHQTTKANSNTDAYAKIFAVNNQYFINKWKHHPRFFRELPASDGY
jgi:GT2 family glycosyltransferase/glycosyltransferase involved in cell wall biosynthesis